MTEIEIDAHRVIVEVDDLALVVVQNKEVLDKVFELACEDDPDDMNIRSAAFAAEVHRLLAPLVHEAFTDEHPQKYEVEEARARFAELLPEHIEIGHVIGADGKRRFLREPVYSGHPKIALALHLLCEWSQCARSAAGLFTDVYEDLRKVSQEWLFENWVNL